jgi:hypothetical protein
LVVEKYFPSAIDHGPGKAPEDGGQHLAGQHFSGLLGVFQYIDLRNHAVKAQQVINRQQDR